mgnify:CR=1 FL=1
MEFRRSNDPSECDSACTAGDTGGLRLDRNPTCASSSRRGDAARREAAACTPSDHEAVLAGSVGRRCPSWGSGAGPARDAAPEPVSRRPRVAWRVGGGCWAEGWCASTVTCTGSGYAAPAASRFLESDTSGIRARTVFPPSMSR